MNPLVNIVCAADVRVADLRRLFEHRGFEAAFVDQAAALIELLEPEDAWRALWLLRRVAETRGLTDFQLRKLVDQLDSSNHWTWRLLLGQLFARVDCPMACHDDIFHFFVSGLDDRRTIVRAWALSALWQLRELPRYRARILRAHSEAKKDKSKAMIARLRHLV